MEDSQGRWRQAARRASLEIWWRGYGSVSSSARPGTQDRPPGGISGSVKRRYPQAPAVQPLNTWSLWITSSVTYPQISRVYTVNMWITCGAHQVMNRRIATGFSWESTQNGWPTQTSEIAVSRKLQHRTPKIAGHSVHPSEGISLPMARCKPTVRILLHGKKHRSILQVFFNPGDHPIHGVATLCIGPATPGMTNALVDYKFIFHTILLQAAVVFPALCDRVDHVVFRTK